MPLDHFLRDLAVVLVVAAFTTVVFQRLRLPVVLGYLLAGFLVGPGTPPQLVADEATIRTLSELGVVLLMFSIGLEFRLRRVLEIAPTAGLTAAVEISLMFGLGYGGATMLGWSPVASLFAGGVVSISSTMIVAKVFEEHPPGTRFQEFIYAVLVFEDLVAILLLTVLTAVGAGGTVSTGFVLRLAGGLAVALLAMLGGGMLVVPRVVRAVVRLARPETIVVASIGLCFGMAALGHAAGYSVALGAFLAGCLIAESGTGRQVEREIRPVRDMFAAIFFVAVGMQFSVSAIVQHWPLVLGASVLVMLGKFTGVSVGAFLAGRGVTGALRAGLSMGQIGEFSFIIAGVGLQLDAAPPELFAVAIAVSAVTAFTTPWSVRRAEPLAQFVDRKLPHPLQTFASLYGSWVETLRHTPRPETPGRRIRGALRLLLLDAAAVVTLVLAYGVLRTSLLEVLVGLGLPTLVARVALTLAILTALGPFVVGIVAVSRRLAATLAERAIPRPQGKKVDNALAPRRLLSASIQLTVVLLIGIPLVAVTQAFLPALGAVAVLGGVLLLLGIGFWRSARDLQGHMRAGAELVVSALAKQSAVEDSRVEVATQLLPGLGDFTAVRIDRDGAVAGRSLGELNLRGRTGATIVALLRGTTRIAFPEATERLAAGDMVALTGSEEAIRAASRILHSTGAPPPTTPEPA